MKISSSIHFLEPVNHLAKTQEMSVSGNFQKNSSKLEDQSGEIAKLRARDTKVRAHEQAHAAAAAGLAKGGPNFTYERGSDGKLYAVGGEVNIDTSPVSGNPEATIRKAKQIQAAALAPADPSAQDRAVAASATAMEVKARQELQQERRGQSLEKTDTPHSPADPFIDIFV